MAGGRRRARPCAAPAGPRGGGAAEPSAAGPPRGRSSARAALRAACGPGRPAVPLDEALRRLGGGAPAAVVVVPRALRGVLVVLPQMAPPGGAPSQAAHPGIFPAEEEPRHRALVAGSARRGVQGALARVLLRAARRGRWEDSLPWAGRTHPWEDGSGGGDSTRGFAPLGVGGGQHEPFLLSAPWVELLRRCGAARLEALLARCPVFAPTGGRGYVQVGGPLILEAAREWRGPLQPPGMRPAHAKSASQPAMARAGPTAPELAALRSARAAAQGGGPSLSEPASASESTSLSAAPEGAEGACDDQVETPSGGFKRRGADRFPPGERKRRRRSSAESGPRTPRGWRPPSEQVLPRSRMFYHWRFPQRPGLPPHHCLAQAAADPSRGVERLVATIFSDGGGAGAGPPGAAVPGFRLVPLDARGRAPRPRFLPRRGAGSVVPLLCDLLANFERCPFPQLLGHYCPAKSGPDSAAGGAELSCSHREVHLFLRACVVRVVPAALLGCLQTRRALWSSLSQLVRAKRYTRTSLQQALQGVRTSSFPWGGGRVGDRGHQASQRATQAWVTWILGSFALPLLAANFYVTEAGHSRQRVFFFRRCDWVAVCAQARQALALREGVALQRLSRAEMARMASARRLGFGQVRVLPKGKATRALVNLSKGVVVRVPGRRTRFPAVNQQLRGAYLALRLEASRRPGLLGSSVFSFAGVQGRLMPYLARWKKLLRSGHPRPFIVSVDVQRAFDTIPTRKLWPIICELLQEPAYALHQYSSLAPSSAGGAGRILRVTHRNTCTRLGEDLAGALGAAPRDSGGCEGGVESEGVAEAGGGRNATEFRLPPRVRNQNSNAPGWRALCAPRGAPKAVKRQAIMRLLRELLFEHVVRMNGKFYRQRQGIPQGSLLSTLLCSLLYAEMERQHVLEPPREAASSAGAGTPAIEPRLVRWVDDFLFISPSQEQAEAFAGKMVAGIPEYGCRVNVAKTASNFDLHLPGAAVSHGSREEFQDSAGNRFVRWCGLLLNCETLDVQHDYSRYRGDEMSAAITVSCGRWPMRRLGDRLVNYLQAKTLPIVLDSAVNSALVVQVNLYQLFLFAAVKCHCYVKAHGRSADPSRAVFDAVLDGVEWVVNRCRQLGVRAARGSEVRWLGLRAFLTIFSRKRRFHASAVTLLADRLRAPEFRGLPGRLSEALSPARHDVFAALSY